MPYLTDSLVSGFSFVDRDMMMRHYWGLGVGHTYARISAANAQSLYLISHQPLADEHGILEDAEGQSEEVDEDTELGDDDMVYTDDDYCSDDSSIYGLGDAERAAKDDMYGY